MDTTKPGTTTSTVEIGGSTHELGWSFLHQVQRSRESDSNTIISPLSIAIAVGMLAGGAEQARRTELCKKLGAADHVQLQAAYSHLVAALGANTVEGQLTMANAIFTDRTAVLTAPFKDHVASFQAESTELDDLPGATKPINDWIAEHTLNMIRDMLTPSDLKDAKVVLVNALAFKGAWSKKFDLAQTDNDYDFNISPDQTIKVGMMFKRNESVQTSAGNGFTAIRLPYKAISSESSMHLIAYLPDVGLSVSELLPRIQDSVKPQFRMKKYGKFGFPKMEMETKVDVDGLLVAIGFPIEGDYPEMGQTQDSEPLRVGSMLHRAVMKLDEEGTVAAAATVVRMIGKARPPKPPPDLIFDRPFAFSIVAEMTGAVVFNGIFAGK